MSQIPLPGAPDLGLTLKRSARARRFTLRVSRLDGGVTLTLPKGASEAAGLAFALEKAEWLRAALARAVPLQRPAFGETIPFQGRALRLTAAPVKAPRVEGEALLLPADPERLCARLEAFLKFHARVQVTEASDRYARALKRGYTRLTLRDARSRWGSCAPDGALMYNWRLIMAPPAVLDYVCAHEVAHLAQMNHSPAFWAEVARLKPDYARDRAWLKAHGGGLQAIRFRD